MRRFGKLDRDCTAIGVGAGKELVLFYLANHVGHVHAMDLYNVKEWESFASCGFSGKSSKIRAL